METAKILKFNQQVSSEFINVEQENLIRKTITKDATVEEHQWFMHVCRTRRLDPLLGQIHFQKRNVKVGEDENNKPKYEKKMTIITGIDGYRLTAQRTDLLAGIGDVIYDTEKEKHPNKATVTVKRILPNGQIGDYTASARWTEYYPGVKQGYMWDKMGYHQLGKCAEALALRKAFPDDLSGIYTDTEMEQSDKDAGQPQASPKPDQAGSKSAKKEPTPQNIPEPLPQVDEGKVTVYKIKAVQQKKKGDSSFLKVITEDGEAFFVTELTEIERLFNMSQMFPGLVGVMFTANKQKVNGCDVLKDINILEMIVPR